MKKSIILIIVALLVFFTACFEDDGGQDDYSNTGLSVTVNTPDAIWGTGDSNPAKVGSKKNYVYLYSALGTKSSSYPVLYSGSGDTNNSAVVVTGVQPGDYYVVVFYDYYGGSNDENLLNKTDYYAIQGSGSTVSPYVEDAATVSVTLDNLNDLIITIDSTWTLGESGQDKGRLFMTR
ncbi:MAG: hypothetical protein GY754_39915 [bacterium]|nr:hypothetical protein [bacterium]